MSATVAIIGGGFAGILTAVNLVRQACLPLRIVLIESKESGRGMAFSTKCQKHLLNVPAGRMSAFPDEPLHFIKWARQREELTDTSQTSGATPQAKSSRLSANSSSTARKSDKTAKIGETAFLKRSLYGEYIENILASTLADLPPHVTFDLLYDEAISVKLIQDQSKAVVKLGSGEVVVADRVVLATGNFAPSTPSGISQTIANSARYTEDPWSQDAAYCSTIFGDALLVGTGLTMIDKALEMLNDGFEGNIYAISRHGILPASHSKTSLPAYAQTELNQDLYGDLNALVRAVRNAIKEGSFAPLFDNASSVNIEVSDWRQIIDALRPHSQALWMSFNEKQKRTFVRHLRTYWDTHRHRMAPEIAEEVERHQASGRLNILAGRIYSVQETADSLIATVSPRHGQLPIQLKVGQILNCSGVTADFRRAKTPLAYSLLSRGIVSAHPTGLGINVLPEGNVIDAAGKPSNVVFTLGNATMGLKGETTAVPELRVQARDLATRLLSMVRTDVPMTIEDILRNAEASGSYDNQSLKNLNLKG